MANTWRIKGIYMATDEYNHCSVMQFSARFVHITHNMFLFRGSQFNKVITGFLNRGNFFAGYKGRSHLKKPLKVS